jgi:tetratricopeptide (TPR) repeat protein
MVTTTLRLPKTRLLVWIGIIAALGILLLPFPVHACAEGNHARIGATTPLAAHPAASPIVSSDDGEHHNGPIHQDASQILIQDLLDQRTQQHHRKHAENAKWMNPHPLEPIIFPAERVKAEQPFNQGLSALQQGQYWPAVRAFDRAVRIDPSYAKAWMHQGDAYMQMNRPIQAVASYNQAIKYHKTFAWLYTSRGKAQAAAGQYTLAIADYDRALQVYPEDPQPLYHRGKAAYAMGNYDQAEQDWQGAIKRLWKFHQAYQARGDLRRERGNLVGAMADYQAGLKYAEQSGAATSTYFRQQISQLSSQIQAQEIATAKLQQTTL